MQRILKGAASVIQNTFLVGETGTDSEVAVTIEVVRDNGDIIVPAGTPTTAGATGTGIDSFLILPEHADRVDVLTARWTGQFGGGAATVTLETQVEVVGGFFFTLAAARASDSNLASTTKYPTARIREVRNEVEDECEEICGVAWVRRYARQTLDGTGTGRLIVERMRPRRVFFCSIDDVALGEDELAALVFDESGLLRRRSGVFNRGVANIDIGYEHGYDQPPSDIRQASLVRLRNALYSDWSGISDRAMSQTNANGESFRLLTAGIMGNETDIPFVNAAYARHNHRVVVG